MARKMDPRRDSSRANGQTGRRRGRRSLSGEGIRAGFGLLSRLKNRPVQYLLDVSVLSAALLLAYAIRFDFHVSPETFRLALAQLPLVVLLQIPKGRRRVRFLSGAEC